MVRLLKIKFKKHCYISIDSFSSVHKIFFSFLLTNLKMSVMFFVLCGRVNVRKWRPPLFPDDIQRIVRLFEPPVIGLYCGFVNHCIQIFVMMCLWLTILKSLVLLIFYLCIRIKKLCHMICAFVNNV